MWDNTITDLANSIGFILYYIFKFIEAILNPYVILMIVIAIIFLIVITLRYWRDALDYGLKR